jgi:ribosomal protein RSM22 (predicted rRNA methylase)
LIRLLKGTPDGFNALRSVRSMLLDCCPPDDESNIEGEEECHVIAPCTHNGTCPMVRHQKNFHKNMNLPDIDEEVNDDDVEGGDDIDVEKGNSASASETDAFDSAFCSFVHVMPGGTQRKQGEKFAYLVVQKRICGSDNDLDLKNPFSDTNIVDLLKKSLNAENKGSPRDHDRRKSLLRAARDIEDKFLDSDSDRLGLELVRGDNRKSWGRIIRAPLKKKGHVYVDYCASVKDEEGTETGRIVRSTVSRAKSAKLAPGMFLSSRKSRWGGLWPDLSSK